jgi:pyruvate dehydrogenase E1 component
MDMKALQPDLDPVETQEWLSALRSVLAREGKDRANFLLDRLVQEARQAGAYIPYSANTAYLNTIPQDQEPVFPGDAEMEHKLRSLVRWNAMATVISANKTTALINKSLFVRKLFSSAPKLRVFSF